MEETQQKKEERAYSQCNSVEYNAQLIEKVSTAHREFMSAIDELWEYDRVLCISTFSFLDMMASGIMMRRMNAVKDELKTKVQKDNSAE